MVGSFFSKDKIEVTQTTARFGNTTYPIANIGAVSIERQEHRLHRLAILVTIGGVIWAIGGESKIAAVLVAIAGAGLWFYCKRNYGAKLMLRTSSGNQQAFESPDRKLVAELKAAIELAVHSRG